MAVGTLIFVDEENANAIILSEKQQLVKKYQPVWEQQVVDSQGRRRLHGAFTGGFSAGYYNTVGSEEGWAPASFSSSRANRAQYDKQRPEDFMDEEDLGVLSSGPVAKAEFDTLEQKTRSLAAKSASVKMEQKPTPAAQLFGGEISNLFIVPTTTPIGKKLMYRMGWKEGQKVGAKRSREDQLEMGEESDESDESDGEITRKRRKLVPKNDFYGLGYDPLHGAPEFAEHRRRKNEDNSKQRLHMRDILRSSITYQGFGIGALEESDDHDIYGHNEKAEYDKYLDEEDPQKLRGLKQKDNFEGQSMDGRPPLPGFIFSDRPSSPLPVFEPPEVPRDFTPIHRFHGDRWDQSDGNVPKLISEWAEKYKKRLTVMERAKELGEKPVAKPLPQRQAVAASLLSNRFESSGIAFPADKEKEDTTDIESKMRESNSSYMKSKFTFGSTKMLNMESSNSQSHRGPGLSFVSATQKTEVSSKETTPHKLIQSTRVMEDWVPERLLCKRFNLRDPFEGRKKPSPKEPKQNPARIFNPQDLLGLEPASQTSKGSTSNIPNAIISQSSVREDKEVPSIGDTILSTKQEDKPPVDLFKAIFEASSDEESEADTENRNEPSLEKDLSRDKRTSQEKPQEEKPMQPSATQASPPKTQPDQRLTQILAMSLGDMFGPDSTQPVQPAKPQPNNGNLLQSRLYLESAPRSESESGSESESEPESEPDHKTKKKHEKKKQKHKTKHSNKKSKHKHKDKHKKSKKKKKS